MRIGPSQSGEGMRSQSATMNRLRQAGVIAILRGQNPARMFQRGIDLAEIGYTAIEVTLDSKNALETIENLRSALDESILIGAGTVLNPQQIESCAKAGVAFALSPIFPDGMIEECHLNNIVAIPGVSNIAELRIAQNAGAEIVKLFPSTEWTLEQLEGVEIPWIPVGGIDYDSIWPWFEAGAWCIGMGANLCGSDLSQEGEGNPDWVRVEAQLARDIFMELQRRHNTT